MAKITLLDIKHALRDSRFRETLPEKYEAELRKYNNNPNCPCNTKFYRAIIKNCKDQLLAYFPGKKVINEEEEFKKLAENHWMVINCHINDLEKELKKLPPGRKQVEASRFEDNVTVIVNEIDVLY